MTIWTGSIRYLHSSPIKSAFRYYAITHILRTYARFCRIVLKAEQKAGQETSEPQSLCSALDRLLERMGSRYVIQVAIGAERISDGSSRRN
jgi:hypothetical protein